VIHLRARTVFEDTGRDRTAIIVEELPYQVNKAKLVERIAQLVHEKRLEGVSDLRDESSREGMRIVIELKRDAVPEIVLNNLFKLTPMQTSFGVILLALVDGQPRVMGLREILSQFLEHRRVVVRRRSIYELDKAEKRAHILEGLRIALDRLDEVIALIREAASPPIARDSLIARLGLSEPQAQAILEMRLQRLTGLEREKINEEYRQLLSEIARLREILADESVLKHVIQQELLEIKGNYQNPRRTVIVEEQAELTLEDLIADKQVVITMTRNGYIKRTSLDIYRSQGRGGKGRKGMSVSSAEDLIHYLFSAWTHSYILIFTDRGRMYWLKVYEIPEVGAAGKGRSLVNLINLGKDEKVADIIPIDNFDRGGYVMMASRHGYIKKTELSAFSNVRAAGIIACSVDEGDALLRAELTGGSDQILLCTQGRKVHPLLRTGRAPHGSLRSRGPRHQAAQRGFRHRHVRAQGRGRGRPDDQGEWLRQADSGDRVSDSGTRRTGDHQHQLGGSR
jgi:DNA gyrase subunit A